MLELKHVIGPHHSPNGKVIPVQLKMLEVCFLFSSPGSRRYPPVYLGYYREELK
jgi:hypothetical protein